MYLGIHFYVIKISIMYHAFSHIMNATTSKYQSYEYFDILYRLNLVGRKVILFLGNKNFRRKKNGNRPPDKDISRVMIKILAEL